jgi:hypothetical protein
MPAYDAIERLGGLQAQAPLAPYVGLWSRLAGFSPDEVEGLLTGRSVVRAAVMRATVHLLTAEDFAAFRPLFSPLLDRVLRANFASRLSGVDLADLVAAAREILAQRALTRAALGRELAERWTGTDPMALAHGATFLLPVVQVPPRGLWGKSSQATWFGADAWLSDLDLPQHDPRAATQRLVLRCLAAFGPASVSDIQAWSGLSRLREVTDRLRLPAFRGPDGTELLDLPDAPLPDPETPVPPRFLPEYDNLLLSYADRRRVIPHDRPVPLPPGNGATQGTLIVDGFWDATWKLTKNGDRATLAVAPFRRLTAQEQSAITEEGARLLGLIASRTEAAEVRFVADERSAG